MSASIPSVSEGVSRQYFLDNTIRSYDKLQSDVAQHLDETANATIAPMLFETFWGKISVSPHAMHSGFTLTKQRGSLTLEWLGENKESCSMSFNMDGTVEEDQSEGTQVVSGDTEIPVVNGVETNGWHESPGDDDPHDTTIPQ